MSSCSSGRQAEPVSARSEWGGLVTGVRCLIMNNEEREEW